mgnify:CR=1 FL=1
MSTVLRGSGFRVVIYANDHNPAHVHVFGSGEAKVNLMGTDGRPQLIWAFGMKVAEVRKAMHLVDDHQVLLLEAWDRIHG